MFLRASVAKALSQLGYRVLEAGNGIAGLDVWQQHREETSFPPFVLSFSHSRWKVVYLFIRRHRCLRRLPAPATFPSQDSVDLSAFSVKDGLQ